MGDVVHQTQWLICGNDIVIDVDLIFIVMVLVQQCTVGIYTWPLIEMTANHGFGALPSLPGL
jgi:hypothetical protein